MDAEALRKEITEKEITEKVQAEFESQLRELRRHKNNAEEELDIASERWRSERRKLKSEIDQLEEKLANVRASRAASTDWQEERERLYAQISGLEASLEENAAQLEQLRRGYEVKIEELADQNERLKQELESGAIVAATEVRLVPAIDSTPIEAEMQHVEGLISAIETLLEDPDTTASMIARKNTERAEKEAYLRGLNFQLTRGRSA